jgi:RNA polymerase sigma factor (sigma-70 family)
MTAETGTMGDELLVTDPVTRARNGDKQAWDALVDRYAPLVWSICRRHRLGSAEASDVGQTVWLRLLDELATVRDQAALPGWLATATLRECGRVLRAAGRQQAAEYMLDAGDIPGGPTGMVQHELRMAERNAALREAFTQLPRGCQQLIAMLMEDPAVPDAEIGARLGIPAGSAGPERARCLEQLRRYPAVAALMDADRPAALTVRAPLPPP